MFCLNDMSSRIKLASILIVLAYLVVTSSKRVKVRQGPSGMPTDEGTNCSEFAKFGRFNPYSVLNEKWFVFYYWAPIRTLTTYVFTAPSANHTRRLKKLFAGNCVLPVQWDVRQLLMEDDKNYISLLVERSDRGEYWLYPVVRVRKNEKITPRDIRLKQTGDNRLLGLLDCADDTLIVMSRLNDVPPKGRLHEEASRLGYRGRKGKSYLYQGHEWGPIDEADEDMFWDRRKPKTIPKDTSTEDKSSEESSEEAEQPTNEPGYSKVKKPKTKKSTVLAPEKPQDDEMCAKVMPELWNDPPPNPNPDNLLTQEDLKELDSMIDFNDTLTIEGPDGSTDNKQQSNVDKESENLPENDKLQNHNEAQKIDMPHSTDNKNERNSNNESDNPPEYRKLNDHKDVHKMDTPDSTKKGKININEDVHKMVTPDSSDNKQKNNINDDAHKMETLDSADKKEKSNINDDAHKMETLDSTDNKQKNNINEDVHEMETPDSIDNNQKSNLNKESENPPKNDNPHNHKVCPVTEEPDDDNEECVVCYKSQVNYVSGESYIPDSSRSMPGLKANEDASPKEVPNLKVPSFKIGGVELPLEKITRTEVPIAKVPAAETPRTEVPTLKVPSIKTPRTEESIPTVPSAKTPRTEVPTPKVLRTKTRRAEEPGANVPGRTQAPPPLDLNSSEIIYLTPKTLDDHKS